eukprot:2128457-Pleurochrysis_carterae.AAC.1
MDGTSRHFKFPTFLKTMKNGPSFYHIQNDADLTKQGDFFLSSRSGESSREHGFLNLDRSRSISAAVAPRLLATSLARAIRPPSVFRSFDRSPVWT